MQSQPRPSVFPWSPPCLRASVADKENGRMSLPRLFPASLRLSGEFKVTLPNDRRRPAAREPCEKKISSWENAGMKAESNVVLFDGVCNLCNGFVRFILERDRGGRFRFASLQSDAARRLLGGDPPAETMILMEGGKTYRKSAGALRIVRRLRFPWPLLYALVAVPHPLRDLVYDWVAGHRYAWFGRRESCLLPAPELRGRFLE